MSKKKRSKKKAVILVLVIIMIIAAIAVGIFRLSAGKTGYTDVVAVTGDIATYYSFSGVVSATNSETVYADSIMQISSVDVSEGQLVSEGDVLMTTSLGKEITAPISGTVAEINVSDDQAKTAGAQLCRIVDYTGLELDVKVDEYDIAAVTPGKTATVTVNALGKDITGTVKSIAREGTTTNGVTYFAAVITLPAEDDLLVGMTAQAKVRNASASGVTLLPESAIQFDYDNKPYVYMYDSKGKIQKVSVTLGISDGTNVEVTDGISAGDTVEIPSSSSSALSSAFNTRSRASSSGGGGSSR